VLDGGCTLHISGEALPGSKRLQAPIRVSAAKGAPSRGTTASSVGDVDEIIHVPDFQHNLVSQAKLCEQTDMMFIYTDKAVYAISRTKQATALMVSGALVAERRPGGLYKAREALFHLGKAVAVTAKALVGASANNATIFHETYNHMCKSGMVELLKGDRTRKPVPYTAAEVEAMPPCYGCGAGKMRRFPMKGSYASDLSAHECMVWADSFGPTVTETPGGHKYFRLIIARRSRLSFLYLMKSELQVAKVTAKFFEVYHAHFRNLPTVMVMDSATNNMGHKMCSLLAKHGCRGEYTVPHGHGNPIEVFMRVIVNAARAVLHQSGRRLEYWGFACLYANYMRNRLPSSFNPGNVSPIQMESGRAPDLNHRAAFGMNAWVHLPHDNDRRARTEKLAPAVKQGVFIGYDPSVRGGYLIYFPDTGSILTRRDVRFTSPHTETRGSGDASFIEFSKCLTELVGSGAIQSTEGGAEAFADI